MTNEAPSSNTSESALTRTKFASIASYADGRVIVTVPFTVSVPATVSPAT